MRKMGSVAPKRGQRVPSLRRVQTALGSSRGKRSLPSSGGGDDVTANQTHIMMQMFGGRRRAEGRSAALAPRPTSPPSPFALARRPGNLPRPSPLPLPSSFALALTLHLRPCPSPSSFTFTLRPCPHPSPLSFTLALRPCPHPSPSPAASSLSLSA